MGENETPFHLSLSLEIISVRAKSEGGFCLCVRTGVYVCMRVHIVMQLYLSAHSQGLCGIVEAVSGAALSGSTSSSSVSLPEVEACHVSATLLSNTLLLHTQFSFSATVIEVNYHILLFLWVLRLSSHLPAWTAKPLTH